MRWKGLARLVIVGGTKNDAVEMGRVVKMATMRA